MKNKYTILIFTMLIIIGNSVSGQHTNFTHEFAPTDDHIKPMEKPYRDDVCLNGSWNFYPVDHAEKLSKKELMNPSVPSDPSWETTRLKVPSPWNVNSFAKGDGGDFVTYPSYPEKWEKVRAGWLMRKIPYNKEWKSKRIILHFDAVNGYTEVFVNKQKVGENFDLFLPFDLDITDKMMDNGDNELMVWIADAKLLDQPGKYGRRTYVGGSFWGNMVTGIWQDVYLLVKPQVNIKSVFAEPFVDSDELDVETFISNESSDKQEINVSGNIMPWINLAGNSVTESPVPRWKLGEKVLELPGQKILLAPNSTQTLHFKVKVSGKLKTWSPETPNLYGLVLNIKHKNETIDQSYIRFGWRQVTLQKDKVYLNGKEIRFKGDSWHFMGIPQMTRRYAWAWFTMLKQCNANAVRLHAEPYPSFYLDMADEMGIFVLDETGMWASDGGPKCDSEEYWKRCEDHLKRFISRDRNHPSVFGWSVCNENIPVVVNVMHAPDSLVKKQLSEINNWVSITRKLDPSRTWISGDGETDMPTDLPTAIGHYGDENSYKTWSSQGKVWGVGECGMAYYGTPHQTSVYNGNRSFESQQGRMEGIAIEAAQLLNLQKKYGASYLSVFNIVWYGLKPLELGLKDTTRVPGPDDGIFFGPYQEGKPGVQPERLGPYTTTLNPGYDSELPLYKPWPLFNAIKNANSDESRDTTTEKKSGKEPMPSVMKSNKATYTVLFSTDKDSAIFNILRDMGIEVLTDGNIGKMSDALLIIDGKYPKNDPKSLALEKSILQQGGNVLVLGIKPESLNDVNKYLPEPVKLTNRNASSFITDSQDAIIKGLGNSDFYFNEISRQLVMSYGLSGDFVTSGRILLQASNTDWRRWNSRPEYMKTGAVIRSERESKEQGNALVVQKFGNGNIYLLSVDPNILYKIAPQTMGQMLLNLGVTVKNLDPRDIKALNTEGVLENSVVIGSFNVSGKDNSAIAATDFLKDVKDEELIPGNNVRRHYVERERAVDGVFDFKKMNLMGPEENAVAYLSFWIYSPRSLVNLLAEPDMPKLDMLIGADDGYQVYLNQKLISESFKQGGLVKREHIVSAVPLEKGWNHFLIKAIQFGGDWKIAIEFKSNNKAFMNDIQSKIAQ
jgi:beta-galactosidase